MKADRAAKVGGSIAYLAAGVVWVATITVTGLAGMEFTQPQSFAVFAVPALAIGAALGPVFTSLIRRRDARRGGGSQVPPPPPPT